MMERILDDKPHPQMSYRSGLRLIRLATQYSPARPEAAWERALLTGAIGYQWMKLLLENGLDGQSLAELGPAEIQAFNPRFA